MRFKELTKQTAVSPSDEHLFKMISSLYSERPEFSAALLVGSLGSKLLTDPKYKSRLQHPSTDVDFLFDKVPASLKSDLIKRFLLEHMVREYTMQGLVERVKESNHPVYGFGDPRYEHVDVFDGDVGGVRLPPDISHVHLKLEMDRAEISLQVANPGLLSAACLAAATDKRLNRLQFLLQTIAGDNPHGLTYEKTVEDCRNVLDVSKISKEDLDGAIRQTNQSYARRSSLYHDFIGKLFPDKPS